MEQNRLITPITIGTQRTFPCVLCKTPAGIGFVSLTTETAPAWLLYPVCNPDASRVQQAYAASDQPLHEVMQQLIKRPE